MVNYALEAKRKPSVAVAVAVEVEVEVAPLGQRRATVDSSPLALRAIALAARSQLSSVYWYRTGERAVQRRG